jgi:hypothetical protein
MDDTRDAKGSILAEYGIGLHLLFIIVNPRHFNSAVTFSKGPDLFKNRLKSIYRQN